MPIVIENASTLATVVSGWFLIEVTCEVELSSEVAGSVDYCYKKLGVSLGG